MKEDVYQTGSIREMQKNIRKMIEEDEEDNVIDQEFQNTPEMQAMKKQMEAAKNKKKLLSNFVFLLGRETPIYVLQSIILSFGGDFILQDELPEDEKEAAKVMKRVTHVCMDRPLPAGTQDKSKEYVQP